MTIFYDTRPRQTLNFTRIEEEEETFVGESTVALYETYDHRFHRTIVRWNHDHGPEKATQSVRLWSVTDSWLPPRAVLLKERSSNFYNATNFLPSVPSPSSIVLLQPLNLPIGGTTRVDSSISRELLEIETWKEKEGPSDRKRSACLSFFLFFALLSRFNIDTTLWKTDDSFFFFCSFILRTYQDNYGKLWVFFFFFLVTLLYSLC